MKVLLILVDGMRPDGLEEIPFATAFAQKGASAMDAKTVFPSVTLPCHMSLFHSVDPGRHGVTTNIYTPPARPVAGLCEQLSQSGKRCAFFYNWEELRDLARPGSLVHSCYYSGDSCTYEKTNRLLTEQANAYIMEESPDFTFLYLGWVDNAGHYFGWLSDEYKRAVAESWRCIEQITSHLSDEYAVIVTADHGGHSRGHGADIPDDMLIPLYLTGKPFAPGSKLENAGIMDIAPTVCKLLDTEPHPDWEGKSLF